MVLPNAAIGHRGVSQSRKYDTQNHFDCIFGDTMFVRGECR